jgi:hypothetical protein
VTRGDGRRGIFHDDVHYDRLNQRAEGRSHSFGLESLCVLLGRGGETLDAIWTVASRQRIESCTSSEITAREIKRVSPSRRGIEYNLDLKTENQT